jgi:hydroxypyruvate reductase
MDEPAARSAAEGRDLALCLFRAALAAVEPVRLVARLVEVRGDTAVVKLPAAGERKLPLPLRVLGAGKAAARMAEGCTVAVGEQHLSGLVIVNDGAAVSLPTVTVREAAHPLPDQRGVQATRELMDLAGRPFPGGTLCLISGGASSLLVCPRPPVSLEDKVQTTRLLLGCGADISEINAVRKHLSAVKGGGLLRILNPPTLTLAVSDVVGDSPSLIGSGPTVADPSTFEDAWNVITRHGLIEQIPLRVRNVLEQGRSGVLPETLKPESPACQGAELAIIASNRVALEGAAIAARERGWTPLVVAEPLTGDTHEAAGRFVAALLRLAGDGSRERRCVLAGGETTVRVRGHGRGGRNQEFALVAAKMLAGTSLTLLSAGTDGIDGPTDAAGAIVDGETLAIAKRRGLDPDAALVANDSYSFLDQVGCLVRCGPTGTNVMDVKIGLIPPAAISG